MQKTPEIRFEGFEGSWEQKKLGEILTEFSNKSVIENQYPVLSSTNKCMELRDGRVSSSSNEGYKIIENGDLVLSPQNLWLGNININNIGKGLVSPSYKTFKVTGVNELFLNPQLRTSKMLNAYKDSSTQGASVVRRNLDTDLFNEITIKVPSLSEQTKIGEYFAQLDNAITLNQRKAEQYKTLKKYMLQKMFPKNGEKVPEIRFEGFTDAWEQRKVSELLEERNEQAPMSDEYPLMAFIANEGVAPKGERYDRSSLVNDTKNKLYKKTEFGDFIYSSNNLETGSIGLNKYGNASISPVYSIFKPTGIADSDFIGRRFVRRDFIDEMVRWRQGVVYGQWKIHESDFMKIEVAVPSIEEQRKIGKYLDQLDNAITLHQRKSDEFRILKKYMLQKMFPKQ